MAGNGGRVFLPFVLILLAFSAIGVAGGDVRAGAPGFPRPLQNSIVLDTSPSGLILEVNGTPVRAPYTWSCDPGNSVIVTGLPPQMNGSTRYVFSQWSDSGNQSHLIVCDSPRTVTATYATEFRLLIDSNPTGREVFVSDSVNTLPVTTPAELWCGNGSSRMLNAFQQQVGGVRYVPMIWSDGGPVNRTVVCDQPRSLRLIFRTEFLIGVFSNVPGLVVTVDGSSLPTPAEYWCTENSTVTIAAPPDQKDLFTDREYTFAGWTDGGPDVRTVPCNRPANYTATFIELGGPDVRPIGPSLPVFLLAVFGIVGLTVLIPFVGVRIFVRRRAASPS